MSEALKSRREQRSLSKEEKLLLDSEDNALLLSVEDRVKSLEEKSQTLDTKMNRLTFKDGFAEFFQRNTAELVFLIGSLTVVLSLTAAVVHWMVTPKVITPPEKLCSHEKQYGPRSELTKTRFNLIITDPDGKITTMAMGSCASIIEVPNAPKAENTKVEKTQ